MSTNMYQVRYYKKVRRKKSIKSYTLLISLILLLFLKVSGVIAYLTDSTNKLTNVFKIADVTTKVTEDLNGKTKSNVKIQNTGTTNAWIRAKVVISWQDKDGNVYGSKSPYSGTDYEIEYGSPNDWIKGNDGFYYYKNPVSPNDSTDNLINSCEILDNANIPNGYNLCVEIICSGIQSDPSSVFNDEWGTGSNLKVNTDGNSLVVKTGGTS